MKWTKELPNEPGWYFWRMPKLDLEQVYYVTKCKNGFYFGACKWSQSSKVKPDPHVLWAGPIPEPALPEPEEE